MMELIPKLEKALVGFNKVYLIRFLGEEDADCRIPHVEHELTDAFAQEWEVD